MPLGVTHAAPSLGGYNIETGARIIIHTFHFHDKATGRRAVVKIPADPTVSQAQIEDMAASAFERWLIEVRLRAQERSGKHAPSREERLEVGKALREFRAYAAKRRASTTGKLYYTLPKVGT